MTSLDRLLDSILMVKQLDIHGNFVNPLNAESFNDEYASRQAEQLPDKRKRFECAKAVLEKADRDGGVDVNAYASHSSFLNGIARKVTGLYSSTFDEDLADNLDLQATPLLKSAYKKKDVFYTTPETNIFALAGLPAYDEGTLFDRWFNHQSGLLEKVRLYNQVHRNTLKIDEASWPEMYREMKSYVNNYSERIETVDVDISRDEYLDRIEEFNLEYGDMVSFIVDDDTLWARFEKHPLDIVCKVNQHMEGVSMFRLNDHPVISSIDGSYLDMLSQEEFEGVHTDKKIKDERPCYSFMQRQPLFAKRIIGSYIRNEQMTR